MSSIIRIGDLTLDTGRRLLVCGTEPIQLGPLTYRLLLALVEAAPNIATHEELIDSVWGGRDASPETISQRVKLLRDAISDDAANPRYIQLVRGQGYRLIPPVKVLPAGPAKRHWNKAVAAIIASLFLVMVAAVFYWLPATPEGTPQESNSIAVLPFVDMSPEQDQAYFADGISEEILNLLANTTTLRVIGRTSSFSFKGQNVDVARIAEALDVTHVLEGSVRKSGNRVRITAQLVDASDGTHLWSESYDRELGDILTLQRELAASVAGALNVNLQGQELNVPSAARPVNDEAFDLYLRGQQKLRTYSEASFAEAKQYFERSIQIDPEFIPAYYNLGFVYVLQVVDVQVPMPENRAKLRDVVIRGLKLAPENAGMIGLSGQLARYDGNIELAEQRLRRALEIDPSNIPVRNLYSMFKLDQSYPDETLKLSRRSLEIDPLNPGVYIGIAASHMDLGNAEKAIATASHYQEVAAPGDATGIGLTGIVKMLLLGDLVGSIRDTKMAVEIWLQGADPAYGYAMLYYYVGDLEQGDAALKLWRKYAADSPVTKAAEAYRHVVYGEIAEARDLAVTALATRKKLAGVWGDFIVARLAIDALIERGEAHRAVDLIVRLAPEYASYRALPAIDAQDFSPAPVAVKSPYTSYPALYFPDYIRALRAAGDDAGAKNMLHHMEAILQLRRERGLFIEERHTAEALALRGQTEAALDALERAELDRTIYHSWQLFLLHNEIFAEIRDHPRFGALLERVRSEMNRQREELIKFP